MRLSLKANTKLFEPIEPDATIDVFPILTDGVLPDSIIEDNNLAQYYLMMSNDAKHLELENLQYGRN